MTWHTRLGRLSDHLQAERPSSCQEVDCCIASAPYLGRTDWIGAGVPPAESPRFKRLCANHAAKFAHVFNCPFPPGYWKDDEVGRPPKIFEIPPGTPLATCTSCRENIRWIVTANGKRMPANLDGSSHFATCPNADQHRRR
jgi:hypothetical protein